MTDIRIFPKLYGTSSSGKIKEWQITVEEVNGVGAINTYHGYVGQKITHNIKYIYTGKNIGKKNETSPYEQAVSEAQSTYNKKIDEQYKLNYNDPILVNEIPLPMLAHEFSKRGKSIVYPCCVQPKLNGVRCLITRLTDRIRATSRGGKEYKAIFKILEILNNKLCVHNMLDGELYSHNLTFQEIVCAIKNETELDINLDKIEYWVYDYPVENVSFAARYEMLAAFTNLVNDPLIKLVPTYVVNNEEELMQKHLEFVNAGYEGTMIRNTLGLYTFKHRSVDLQKLKDFMDDEFEIIGGEEGCGLAEGQCIFICQTAKEQPFKVRCIGPNSVREEQWNHLKDYIGKMLTVKYQAYSDIGIPIFPVGISIRNYE